MRLTISAIHLGSVLDIVKVLIKSAFTGISGRSCCFLPQNAYEKSSSRDTGPTPGESAAISRENGTLSTVAGAENLVYKIN